MFFQLKFFVIFSTHLLWFPSIVVPIIIISGLLCLSSTFIIFPWYLFTLPFSVLGFFFHFFSFYISLTALTCVYVTRSLIFISKIFFFYFSSFLELCHLFLDIFKLWFMFFFHGMYHFEDNQLILKFIYGNLYA